jgi:hypothetical protein
LFYSGYILFAFLVNLLLSLLVAKLVGQKRNIGFGWTFFFCLFLSPLLGLLIALLSDKKRI